MKTSVFYTLLILAALTVSTGIYYLMLPEFIREGGPLVIVLITLTLMVITFVVERMLSLRQLEGKRPAPVFISDVRGHIAAKRFENALGVCRTERGTLAVVLGAGIQRYLELDPEEREDRSLAREEVRDAVEETITQEIPALEKNLVALSTIASIATMVGLLGTVIGMIRSFRALAHAGAPDAVQLSIGISEALINTAGGLLAAIAAIVAYNYFVTRIDAYTNLIDEASASLVQALVRGKEHARTAQAR